MFVALVAHLFWGPGGYLVRESINRIFTFLYLIFYFYLKNIRRSCDKISVRIIIDRVFFLTVRFNQTVDILLIYYIYYIFYFI